VIMVSRFHTMHPDSDTNLNRFIDSYARVGAYFFMPAAKSRADIELIDENYIAKRELNIRYAWQVGRHDPDSPAIRDDDEPFIPTGEKNPPVKELLESRRERRR